MVHNVAALEGKASMPYSELMVEQSAGEHSIALMLFRCFMAEGLLQVIECICSLVAESQAEGHSLRIYITGEIPPCMARPSSTWACSGHRQQSSMPAGHSLGGALAELAAHSLVSRLSGQPYAEAISQRMCCYTFGAPRVGNAAWADEYETLVPATFHIINDQAGVCSDTRQQACVTSSMHADTLADAWPGHHMLMHQ